MKVKALVSFSGTVSMAVGEVAEIGEGEVLTDLLRAGYVQEAEKAKAVKPVENQRNKRRTN